MTSPSHPDLRHLDDLRIVVAARDDGGAYLALVVNGPYSATGPSPRAALLALVDLIAPAVPAAPGDA